MLPAEARALADASRERLVTLCGDLVAARSELPAGDTRAPAAVLAAYLAEVGLAPELRARVAEKPNVVCRVGAAGRHLVLNGHLDTLSPGRLEDWTVPPFAMTRAGGRLTGLGIGNMKAGVAALAVAFATLAPRVREGALTFTAVADEVAFGPDGAAFLLDSDPTLAGDGLINAEGPGEMRVALAEKGLLWLELTAEAPPGQGMLSTRGSGAIARLSRVLAALDRWNDERATPPASIAMVDRAGDHGLRLSVNIGRIEGGDFISQVATRARAEVDMRVPPGLTIAAVADRVEALAQPDGVSMRIVKGWDPSWSTPDTPVVSAVLSAAEAVRGRAVPAVRLPASDAARWRSRGVPAVCFGPQPLLASGVDDFVREDDVVDCVAVYLLAASRLLELEP